MHWLLFEDMQRKAVAQNCCAKIALQRRNQWSKWPLMPSNHIGWHHQRLSCPLVGLLDPKISISHVRLILSYESAPAQFKASSTRCAHRAVCSVSFAGWLKGMRADIKADLCYGGLKIASLNWHWVTLVLLLGTESKPKGISGTNIARIANAVPHPSSI